MNVKLSEAIERALVKGVYDASNPYMCNAMYSMGYPNFEADIAEMLDTISPDNYTLIGALGDVYPDTFGNMNYLKKFAYTSQLYCWWVFDLKRKGL
jgi:hypothetical protein